MRNKPNVTTLKPDKKTITTYRLRLAVFDISLYCYYNEIFSDG